MSDWYPKSRDEQLHLVETWNTVFAAKGVAWGIPEERITQLVNDTAEAVNTLAVVKSGERTAASVVQCNEAFKNMETEARFIKKHYLLLPPLTLADLPTLLLPLPDNIPTPVGPPSGQPSLTLSYPGGPHLLQVHLSLLTGMLPPDSRSDYGYALYRGIMPQGGATLEQAAGSKHYLMQNPLSGDELLHYKFTRRKKELVGFLPEESGMTAWFCARYENQKGSHGEWGTAASAVVP